MRTLKKIALSIVMLSAVGTPLLRGQASTFQEEMVINGIKFDIADFRFGTLDPTQPSFDPAQPALEEFTVVFPNKLSAEQVAALESLKEGAPHPPSFHPSPLLIVLRGKDTEVIYTFTNAAEVGESYMESKPEMAFAFTTLSENKFQIPPTSPTNPKPCFDGSNCTGPS